MVAFAFPAFPAEIGAPIDVPDIAALLFMPMFRRADVAVFHAHASPFQRALFAQAPLRGGFAHTYVDASVQLLHPGVTALGTRSGRGILEWHLDGIEALTDPPSVFHALSTPCTAATEFNAVPFTLDAPANANIAWLNTQLSVKAAAMPLRAEKMPPNRFVTWTTHVHRSAVALHPEFRFFFRVTESNVMPPIENSKARSMLSVVHGLSAGWPVLTSVSQTADTVVLHKTWADEP